MHSNWPSQNKFETKIGQKQNKFGLKIGQQNKFGLKIGPSRFILMTLFLEMRLFDLLILFKRVKFFAVQSVQKNYEVCVRLFHVLWTDRPKK